MGAVIGHSQPQECLGIKTDGFGAENGPAQAIITGIPGDGATLAIQPQPGKRLVGAEKATTDSGGACDVTALKHAAHTRRSCENSTKAGTHAAALTQHEARFGPDVRVFLPNDEYTNIKISWFRRRRVKEFIRSQLNASATASRSSARPWTRHRAKTLNARRL